MRILFLNTFFVVVITFFVVPISANTPSTVNENSLDIIGNTSAFKQANSYYNKGAYQKAISSYESILKSGNTSSAVHFNLANAYFKNNELAPSAYHYEKALVLDPTDSDIKTNYQFVKNARIDQIPHKPKGFLKSTYQKLMQNYTQDFWGYCAIATMLIFIITFIGFYISSMSQSRQLLFSAWLLAAFASVLFLVLAFVRNGYDINQSMAIVYEQEVPLYSEPNSRSEVVIKLHEATKVQLKEKMGNWTQVILSDGTKAWAASQKAFKLL